MSRDLFHLTRGIIPACDVETLEDLSAIVKKTHDIEGVVGYKIGCTLALAFGLSKVTDCIGAYSNLPIIYDHQKASTDIPQLGEKFAEACRRSDVKGVILFPQAGPSTEESFISALLRRQMTPIVGGEMTHPRYLAKDGGFIRNGAPKEMYEIAARNGVEHFILPGNKPEALQEYDKIIAPIIDEPRYCMPGIGTQGGDIEIAFEAVRNRAAYAIIGSSIYKAKDMRKAASEFSKAALAFL